MEKKPRPHAELIKLWADGAQIEYKQPSTGKWLDSDDPAWVADYEYRVKPAREYPKLAAADVSKIAEYFCLQVGTIELVSQSVFRHALDNGQVVTREEFAKVAEEAKCATNSLIAAGYKYRGGELWLPPLGSGHYAALKLAGALRVIGTLEGKDKSSVIVIHAEGERFTLGEYIDNVLKAAGIP